MSEPSEQEQRRGGNRRRGRAPKRGPGPKGSPRPGGPTGGRGPIGLRRIGGDNFELVHPRGVEESRARF